MSARHGGRGMARNDGALRRLFRGIPPGNIYSGYKALDRARQEVSPSSYSKVLEALRTAAPTLRDLPTKQPRIYQDLLYRPALGALSLDRELLWAEVWIGEAVAVINAFQRASSEMQEMFAAGKFGEISERLQTLIGQFGWSFWAAELLLATEQQTGGDAALRVLSKALQLGATNRASGLFAFVLTDRNDSTFPFDSFYLKCLRSTRNFPPWLGTYLIYRALDQAEDPEQSMPAVLAADLSSSIIDYYESIIYLLDLIRAKQELQKYGAAAIHLTLALEQRGISDPRLLKLRASLGGDDPIELRSASKGTATPLTNLQRRLLLIAGEHQSSSAPNVSDYCARLSNRNSVIEEGGGAAQQEQAELIKLGINFKSLPIGRLVALKASGTSRPLQADSIIRPGADLVLPKFSAAEILVNSDCRVLELLGRAMATDASDEQALCRQIASLADRGYGQSDAINYHPAALWLARYFVRENRLKEAQELTVALEKGGVAWERQATKLRILIAITAGDLGTSLIEAANALASTPESADELDLPAIFHGKRWAEFRDLDPTLVALVAHYAQSMGSNSQIRFICRMACRAFYKAGAGKDLERAWARETDPNSRNRLVAFLRDAWTDEDLALLETFKSTQEIRIERIRVLQHLLAWDPEYASNYSSEIKELTIDETLWQGIQRINQTRVFVNEAAISRWAEKELLPDFERWKLLTAIAPDVTPPDNYISKYEFDQAVGSLIQALPADQRTAANAQLIATVDKLFKQFLLDPMDGLDSFLSSRVRHGTLRGTLLGPLEEANLLVIGEPAEIAFRTRWTSALGEPETAAALELIRGFSFRMQEKVREIVNSRIHVQGPEYPEGAFLPAFAPAFAQRLTQMFSESDSFQYFLLKCYSIFWAALKTSRDNLATYFEEEVKKQFQGEFEELQIKLRAIGVLPLITAVQAAWTATQAQCNVVAEWFVPQNTVSKQTYEVSEAIEIGRRATANVYRLFSSEIDLQTINCDGVSISAHALTIVADCLYVILENAWKHSGLGSQLGAVKVVATLDPATNLLHLKVTNALSRWRATSLRAGELEALRLRNLETLPVELIPREGGSGLAKLARLGVALNRSASAPPLNFGIEADDRWFVDLDLRFTNRDGVLDVAL